MHHVVDHIHSSSFKIIQNITMIISNLICSVEHLSLNVVCVSGRSFSKSAHRAVAEVLALIISQKLVPSLNENPSIF